MTNTTTTQDREINDAESNNHIQNLIDIIAERSGGTSAAVTGSPAL